MDYVQESTSKYSQDYSTLRKEEENVDEKIIATNVSDVL